MCVGSRDFNEEDANIISQFGYRREAIFEGNQAIHDLNEAYCLSAEKHSEEQKLTAEEFGRLWFHRWRFEKGDVDPNGT